MTPNWSKEGFQRIIDAGKRSGSIIKEKSKKLKEEYYESPKLCPNCNNIIPYEKKRDNKYCSKSCSATVINNKRKQRKTCLVCEKEINKGSSKYCSFSCQKTYHFNQKLEEWIKGEKMIKSRNFFRRYLTETYGYKCSCCGIDEWNGKELVLEIDHIDGIPDNNEPQNLRFICPNCHSQTDTYKGKNIGNGRYYRKVRYSNGQSY